MKIFISHSISDKQLIKTLINRITPLGIKLLIAEHYFSTHNTITSKIEKLIDHSDFAIILLTENGFNSNFVHQEIGYIKKAGKHSIQIVETGQEKNITGFIYGKDYLKYDPKNPDTLVEQLTNLLIKIRNQKLRADNKRRIVQVNANRALLAQKKKQENILFGVFAGLLAITIASEK
jgi:hypothetical protein